MDDVELARRSIRGFGEMVAALGASDAVRRPDAIGAKVDGAADNHWLDAAVVPYDATPPAADDPSLPHCVWTTAGAMAEREEVPVIAMPCLGVELAALDGADPGARDGQAPPMAVVGDLNDRAYGQFEALAPLLGGVAGDDRLRAHGVRVEGEWACVALTLRLGDDASVQYVATEERFRRRGLASRLLLAALAAERDAGATTATLQASPDGLGVYERLGFRRVALLKAFVRAP